MSEQSLSVYAVDDDPMIQDILKAILEPFYRVETFPSAEACQARMACMLPDCLLLDIGLPGMDGYEFCRLVKDNDKSSEIPVTFISGHDTIDSRIKGYDAGGEDFIVKPFNPEELLRKVKVAATIVASKQQLAERARASDELSTLALASMGDSGVMLQFMSKLISWYDEKEVADGMLELLRQFSIDGVVQARIGDRAHVVSRAGVNLPLEVSVLNHVRGMDRIFEFRDRAVYNYDRITIMVNNMPVGDEMLCGRIRDNLAIGAQGAASRLESLEVEWKSKKNQEGLVEAVNAIEGTLDALTQANLQSRYHTSQLIYEFEQDLTRSFLGIGLSERQEDQIQGVVRQFTQQLIEQIDQSEGLQKSLESLSKKLHELRSGAA